MTYDLVLRRKQGEPVPPPVLPPWPTPVQTGKMATWGDSVLANVAGGWAAMYWDWPTSALKEMFVGPEIIFNPTAWRRR
jgi:hypothetical protein